MGIAPRQPYVFLAFVQMYSICDLSVSFSSTTIPRIFFSLTCFNTEPFTVILILELFLLFSNRTTCVFCLFMFILHFSYVAVRYKVPPEKTQSHLKSQFPLEMTLLKSQQNFQTCLKPNFPFTPMSNINFKRFSR